MIRVEGSDKPPKVPRARRVGSMTDRASAASRPWRRFLRFSVRGMIVVVLVMGGWLGLLVAKCANPARGGGGDSEEARGFVTYDWERVAAIQETRGRVIFDSDRSDKNLLPVGKPWAPRWLIDIVGVDYFGHVVSVWLPGKTDADNVHVGRLTRLQRLDLHNSYLSDAGMEHLTRLDRPLRSRPSKHPSY